MELIISLVASFVFALVFRKAIKKYPTVFYALAVVMIVLFLSGILFDISRSVAIVGYPYTARCLVGFGFFVVIMYVGVFSEKNRIRQMLMLVPNLSTIEQKAMVSVVVYTVIFASYSVLRIRKAIVDKRKTATKPLIAA